MSEFKLRPYQNAFTNDILKSLRMNRRTLGVLSTGGGKTACATYLINRFLENDDRKVLALMHRDHLCSQWASSLWQFFKINPGIIRNGIKPQFNSRAQIASVQSMRGRLKKGTVPKDVGLIIIDEAHHAPADTYQEVCRYYNDAYNIGVTATPCRTDGRGLGDCFDDMVIGPTYEDLVDLGYLVRSKPFITPIDPRMMGKVRVRAGEYREKDLEELMMSDDVMAGTYSSWEKYSFGKQTIGFAASVDHSKEIAEMFKEKGQTAAHLDAKTKKHEREQILRGVRNGTITYFSNVGIATEGFDVPSVDCVQILRPTKSLGLFMQMSGRGSRPKPGKDCYILLDNANCILNHGLPETTRFWSLTETVKHEEQLVVIKKENEEGEIEMVPLYANELPMETDQFDLVQIDTTVRKDLINSLINYHQRKRTDGNMRNATWSAYFSFCDEMERRSHPITIPELSVFYEHFRQHQEIKSGWIKWQAKEIMRKGIKLGTID